MVLGTWTTRMAPAAWRSSRIAEKAVSSPPMVMSCVTLRRRSELTVCSRSAGDGRRIGPRDAQVRPAAEMDAADGLDRQGRDVFDVPLHEPLEAVADADDVDPLETRADGRCSDDTVDAGRGSAADKDGQSLMMFHSH